MGVFWFRVYVLGFRVCEGWVSGVRGDVSGIWELCGFKGSGFFNERRRWTA